MSTTGNLFDGQRLQMNESIELSLASLNAYMAGRKHVAIAWSGGKDSTALLTFVVWAILNRKVPAPQRLSIRYADTRLELLPLWLTAESIREELNDKAADLAALGTTLDVEVVMAPVDKRLTVYILGRGVPGPNNNTLRYCVRQTKIEPMTESLRRMYESAMDGLLTPGEKVLMLTGVRMGESASRDGRISLSCGTNNAECGQGWYQQSLPGALCDTLAPLLHWRVCHVWEYLRTWAPTPAFGDWSTELLADAYGGVEAAEAGARTGCVGCPLAERDMALDGLLRQEKWAYLAPLKKLRPIWRETREPKNRLRKAGLEFRKDGTPSKNPQRMGPVLLEVREQLLEKVLALQAEVNAAADRLGRPRIDILNAEEEARIRELIALKTWPEKWDGDEPHADEMIDLVFPDGTGQPLLPMFGR